MMTSALKMTALRIALSGEARCMTLSGAIAGKTPTSIAGMIAKYFATSLAMLKVVSAPRVISSCLPISTMSSSFVGFESRSTMLPASGRRLGEEVVDAGLRGDRGRRERIVAGDHHGADAHGPELREALLDAAFDHVL